MRNVRNELVSRMNKLVGTEVNDTVNLVVRYDYSDVVEEMDDELSYAEETHVRGSYFPASDKELISELCGELFLKEETITCGPEGEVTYDEEGEGHREVVINLTEDEVIYLYTDYINYITD